jgi:hypothetical protein
MTWQPIETAPEDVPVLVFQATGPRCIVATLGTAARGKAGRWFEPDRETSKPTHWMPLPEPPS